MSARAFRYASLAASPAFFTAHGILLGLLNLLHRRMNRICLFW